MQPEPPDETTDLLVAYALGALEPEEMARVGRLLDERPDLRALLGELRATADLLPYALPASEPPPELRRRVLDHAVGRAAARPAADTGRRLRGWLYALGGLAAAALVALAVTLGQLGAARAQLAQAQQQLAQAQQQLAQAERQVAAVGAERADLAQAIVGAETIGKLQGSGGEATVLQSADGQVLVAARLPPLAADQVYQLWLVQDGAAQSGGVFTVDGSGFGVIALGPGAPRGVTLAVTAEPAPGSPGPTSDPLVAGQLT
jgi:anti-sigma-K factor RskA